MNDNGDKKDLIEQVIEYINNTKYDINVLTIYMSLKELLAIQDLSNDKDINEVLIKSNKRFSEMFESLNSDPMMLEYFSMTSDKENCLRQFLLQKMMEVASQNK